ncbi:MAG: HipA domain-containing protein, partial [Bacteroidales bacterium]|nr:HipA domain-containing protein [Bacteroidales bacterium]
MKRCLYCYKHLEENDIDFHQNCSKKIFGESTPPLINYSLEDIDSLALEVINSKITLTGVQPKISLQIKSEKGEPNRFTIIGVLGNYILKPQSSKYESLPENEDLSMHLAEIAKIKTVPHTLIRLSDNSLAYITKRIDRDKKGNKIAMEDMCQLTNRLTEYKYKGSYEQIAKIILKYSANPILDIISFFEIILFSYLIGNSDMHLKNFSLCNKKGKHELSPAYDLLSTKMVIPKDIEDLALNLNGKKNNLKRQDFENLIVDYVDRKTMDNSYKKFQNVIPKWFEFIDNSFINQESKEKYKSII